MSWTASIVVPLLRQRDEWLQRAVQSALAQTVPSEVIVVTSPHTPRSNLDVLERARDGAEGRLVVTPRTRSGFPNAINTGLSVATAPRVGVLLSDDWLESTTIEECLAIDADVVSTGLNRYAEDGQRMPHMDRVMRADEYAKRTTLEQKATYLTYFFFFRRARVADVGDLDESLGDAPGIDDYDLIWTLLEHGATVGMTPRPLYNCRVHAGERLTMRDPVAQLEVLGRIFDKHGFTGPAREQRTREHARWFGRSEDVVYAEIRGDPQKEMRQPGQGRPCSSSLTSET